MEETINGKLVFDAALWPPAELGKFTSRRADGQERQCHESQGGSQAKTFEQWLRAFNDPTMYSIAHYSLGFNPGVTKPSGRIVEDERIFGCIEMGMGSQGAQIMGKTWSAASHTDGVVLNPNDRPGRRDMEKDGVYQLEPIVEACRELGVPGY